ncbi:MAG: sensor domain-containing diguanylate cyclase [Nitrospira sp.]|nr:sensor domain-containing diguanylate cyclase [Nitrospira sp.]
MKFKYELYRTVLDNLYSGVFFVDGDRKILYWNSGAERITGFSAQEVVGIHCWDDVLKHVDDHGHNVCEKECLILKTISDGKTWEGELYLLHKNGHRVPVMTRIAPVRDPEGKIVGALEIFDDISSTTALAQKVEELKEMAFLDPLTRLANRRYIEINIKERLSELNRYGWPFGVIFADVDNLKEINDTYGHHVGDLALKMVAKTLPASLRLFDVVGRWGGDEFVAVIVNIRKKHLQDIAHRFLSLIKSSDIHLENEILKITVSIGATIAKPNDTVVSILKRADRLMYKSKVSGGDRVSIEGSLKAHTSHHSRAF